MLYRILFMVSLCLAVEVAPAQPLAAADQQQQQQQREDEATALSPPVLLPNGAGQSTISEIADRMDQRVGYLGMKSVFGVPLWRYGAMLLAFLSTFLLSRFAQWFLHGHASRLVSRTRWKFDDLVFESAGQPLAVLLNTFGVYVGVMFVLAGSAPEAVQVWFGRFCMACAVGAVFWYLYRLVDVMDHYLRKLAERSDNDLDNAVVEVLRKTFHIFIFAVGFIFIGRNLFQWNIAAVLASAGVFGLAIAFAAQDTIANLFGTAMLLLDRPFKVGERVVLDGAQGPVEAIGFRSTRIRTLDGHQVSIPNKTVANTKIENVGRRPHIKRVSNITITYDTPPAKVEKALEIIRGILANHRGMDPAFPPRVFFNEFNASSLNILMIAWYHPADYWEYVGWCEEINLAIMRGFEQEGIEFAFPTTTTYLAHDKQRPLAITMLSGAEAMEAKPEVRTPQR